MLASACLGEESVKGIVASTNSLIARHLAIWLNAMLEAEEFPACVADLHTTLTDVKAKSFTHICDVRVKSLS